MERGALGATYWAQFESVHDQDGDMSPEEELQDEASAILEYFDRLEIAPKNGFFFGRCMTPGNDLLTKGLR